MPQIALGLFIKDSLIIIASLLLILCILRIRKLKKTLAAEVHKRLIPQINLEIDEEVLGLYIKNESFFLAKNIEIEDMGIDLDDWGFKLRVSLKFERIDVLKPHERIALKFKVFDKDGNFLPDLTAKMIPHLVGIAFKLKIFLYNIEGVKFCITLNKKQKKFFTEKVDFCL